MVLLTGAPAGSAALAPDAAELTRIGDRLAAFAVLLPRRPAGRVGVLVEEPLSSALLRRFPGSVALGRGEPSDEDGFGLLIAQESRVDLDAVRALLDPDGTLVVLGRKGSHVVYPDLRAPQQVWRRGWPVPGALGQVADVRRRAGMVLHRLRGAPRIDVQGQLGPTLAEEVAAEVGAALGDTLRLVGLVTAGHTVLRLRGRRDVAVRLSSCDPDGDHLRSERVRAEVPDIDPLLPPVLAHGLTGDMPWVAMPWLPEREVPLLDARRRERRAPAVLARLAEVLAAHPTGHTGPGWAERRVEACTLVGADQRPAFVATLRTLEGRVATGWCHGDPWAGNVVLGPAGPVVIDWDTADPDAPLGMDRFLIACLDRVRRDGVDMATACAEFARRPELLDAVVGGRPWSAWCEADRAALALAGFLLHLGNRALHDLGQERLTAGLRTMSELLTAPPAPAAVDRPTDGEEAVSGARGAGRGALWLAAGAVVTKGYQTIIQLVLAAVLAPSALGVLAVGALITNVVSTLTDMGSSTALVQWRGDPRAPARSALSIGLLSAGVATVIGWIAAPWLSTAMGTGADGVGVIRGLLLCVPLYAVANVSLELMRRDLAFARRVTPDLLSAVVGLVVSLVLVFRGAGVYALVGGQVSQAFVRMVACWVLLTPVRPGWSATHVRALLAYGRHLAGANAVQLLMLNVDYLLVGHLLGAGPLGQYSLAFRLAYMPYLMVTVVVCGAAFPYLCRLGPAGIGAAVGTFARLVMALLGPLYVGMLLLAPALELLGDKWTPAVPVLRWLAAYGLLLSVVQVAQTAFNALGRTHLTFLLNGVHLVALTVLLWLLVPAGITAAGVAQTVAGGGAAVLAAVLLLRAVPDVAPLSRPRDALVGLTALTAMAAVCWGVRSLLPAIEGSLPAVLAVGIAMVLVYGAVLVAGIGPRRAAGAARAVMAR